MANIRKSFNLRNGVQVDNDNFIVNQNGLVGIGTTQPSEILDVKGGNIKCDSTIISNSLIVSGLASASRLQGTVLNSGITSITSGIISATTGVVTYYGDGSKLLNLPTSQWLDIDVGLGFTSIYAQGFVGIATNDPRFVLQVGGTYTNILNAPSGFISGVGINSTGDIISTGNVTAGNFIGNGSQITDIEASNISSGTLNNSRLPSNISVGGSITANKFIGIGSDITLIDASNISLGTLSNSRLSEYVNISNLYVGTSGTVTSLNSNFIGIGTISGSEDIRIFKSSGTTSIRLTSEDDKSSFIFGRNVNGLSQNGVIRFGNNDSTYAGTVPQSLDIINYGIGNVNYYNNVTAASFGNFNWIKGYNTFLMTLTQDGKLGIGKTNPTSNLDIVGTSSISSDLYVGQNVTIQNNLNILSGTFNSSTVTATKVGVATGFIASSYDFQIGGNPISFGGVGIKAGNVYISDDINQVKNINSTGIITATTFDGTTFNGTTFNGNFDGGGSLITNINADNISSGTLNDGRLPSIITKDINCGIVTADTITANVNFVGIGSLITNIDANYITSGTLDGNRLPSTIVLSGDLTAENIVANASLTVNGTFSSDNISVANTITSGDLISSGILKVSNITTLSGFGTFNASAGISTVIDTFSIQNDDFVSAEYTLYLQNLSNIQTQKVLATQNGISAFSSGYGVTFNPNQIGITSVRVSSGNFELLIIPETGISGITTYQFIRQTLSP